MRITEKTSMKVSVKELPPMRVAAYRIVSSEPESDAAAYMLELIQTKKMNFDKLRKFGVDVPVSEVYHRKGLRGYEYLVCIPDQIKNLTGATIKQIPKRMYAVLRIEIPLEKSFNAISNGWLELHDWIETSEYEPALPDPNRYMMEEQIEIDGADYMDLYYPVCLHEFEI
jgi:effector-binding domain-containing protein